MQWLRALPALAVAAAVAGLLTSAGWLGRTPSLQLLRVTELAPRDLEPGDVISILGEGFPSGKAARVTFRGALLRAGERPLRGAEIVTSGTVAGPDHVEVTFDEGLQALFCRAGDLATHTTFQGDVEVAFAAAAAGQPPIAGQLQGITIDARPIARASDSARDAEGERTLALLGVHVAPGAHRTGLLVDRIDPGSRAESAGVVSGDVIASWDHIRVGALADVLPAPGQREAVLGVRHAQESTESPRTLSVTGVRPAPPAELFGPALGVLAALAFIFAFCAPAPGGIDASLDRLTAGVRACVPRLRHGPASAWAQIAASCSTAVREVVPPVAWSSALDAAASGALVVLPFGQYLIAARLDVAILLVAAATTLAAAAFAASGSISRGAVAALRVAWLHVPAAFAVSSVVLMTGSLRVREIGRSQGGWPWEWLAFRSPASLLAFLLLVWSARIEIAGVFPRPVERRSGQGWTDAVCRAHRLIVAGLASALFLGGWSLPGLSAAQQDAWPALEMAGALCFAAKVAGLAIALSWTRVASAVAPDVRLRGVGLAALSVATVVATAAWSGWGLARTEQSLASAGLLVVSAVVAVALVHRLRAGLAASPAGEGHMSPFM